MRLLFVSPYALPHVGGVEAAVDALGRELAARGHAVTHVATSALRPGEGATGEGAADAAGYRAIRVRAANPFEARAGVPLPLFGPALPRALRRELARCDLVHAHGFVYPGTLVAFGLARAARRRPLRVLTEHVGHVSYENAALDLLEAGAIATLGRAAARVADALTAPTPRVATELSALAPRTPCEPIANGVDHERYRPPGDGERERLRAELGWDGCPRALFVGRPAAKKALPLALAAARAGGGAFRLAVVAPLGGVPAGAPHVDRVGPLPRERLAEVYRAADALLLPSHGEGFPLSAQEAMASGLPAVLAHDPSYQPLLDGAGPGARLVAPDAVELSAAVVALVADAEARSAAGAAAARHARAAFSWQRTADAHERLYERAAASRA